MMDCQIDGDDKRLQALTDTEWRQMIGEWMSPDGRFHQDETPEKPWWTQSYWVQG